MLVPERGDIYYIDIPKSEIVGHEFWGSHWYVVVSPTQLNAALGMFTAVPLTSVRNKVTGEDKDIGDFRYFRVRVLNQYKKPEPGQSASILNGDSIALPEQMRNFSVDRIQQPRVGTIDKDGLGAIEAGILYIIGAGIRREAAPLETSTAPKQLPETCNSERTSEPSPWKAIFQTLSPGLSRMGYAAN